MREGFAAATAGCVEWDRADVAARAREQCQMRSLARTLSQVLLLWREEGGAAGGAKRRALAKIAQDRTAARLSGLKA
eukprot:5391157-Pleurochrysis_carterae.AAC.2